MPKKYPDETKRKAVGLLEIHPDISLVHYATGVHRRTLRRWRAQLQSNQQAYVSEKVFASDTKRTQSADDTALSQTADETDNPANTELDDFTYIRDQLLQYARQMAGDLRPSAADSNRRTLALSRVLDRIHWLNQVIPSIELRLAKQQRKPWQIARDEFSALRPTWWEVSEEDEEDEMYAEDEEDEMYEQDEEDEMYEQDEEDEMYEQDEEDEMYEQDEVDEMYAEDEEDEVYEWDEQDVLYELDDLDVPDEWK